MHVNNVVSSGFTVGQLVEMLDYCLNIHRSTKGKESVGLRSHL